MRNSTLNRGALLALAAAMIAGWFAGDSVLTVFLVLYGSFVVLSLWTLLILLTFLWFLWGRRWMEPFKNQFMLWLFAVCLCAVFFFCAGLKDSWREHQAQNFVAVASTQLEQQKSTSKLYPGQLSPDLKRWQPEIVKYRADGKYYVFSYRKPLDVGTSYHYSNQTRTWKKRSTWNN